MRTIIVLVLGEVGLAVGGITMAAITSILPIWIWMTISIGCFAAAAITWFAPAIGRRVSLYVYDHTDLWSKQIPWGTMPERRFRLLYPQIRELADSTPPYDDAKLAALVAQMNALHILHPINEDRWPKYLCMLATLSKKCQLEQARVMHGNHDFRP